MFLINLLILAGLPVILIFTPAIVFVIGYFSPYEYSFTNCLCFCNRAVDNCLCRTIMALIFVPLVFSLGLVVGCIACAILIIPAYLF